MRQGEEEQLSANISGDAGEQDRDYYDVDLSLARRG